MSEAPSLHALFHVATLAPYNGKSEEEEDAAWARALDAVPPGHRDNIMEQVLIIRRPLPSLEDDAERGRALREVSTACMMLERLLDQVEPGVKSPDTVVYKAGGHVVLFENSWPSPPPPPSLPPDGTVLPDGSIVRSFKWAPWTEQGETQRFTARLEIPNEVLGGVGGIEQEAEDDDDGPPPLIDQTQS
jgi:hypothetical protein